MSIYIVEVMNLEMAKRLIIWDGGSTYHQFVVSYVHTTKQSFISISPVTDHDQL